MVRVGRFLYLAIKTEPIVRQSAAATLAKTDGGRSSSTRSPAPHWRALEPLPGRSELQAADLLQRITSLIVGFFLLACGDL